MCPSQSGAKDRHQIRLGDSWGASRNASNSLGELVQGTEAEEGRAVVSLF